MRSTTRSRLAKCRQASRQQAHDANSRASAPDFFAHWKSEGAATPYPRVDGSCGVEAGDLQMMQLATSRA